MSVQLTWVSVGVIIAILVHAYHTVTWSAKITTQLENLSNNLNRLDKELEKRDIQIAASWKRIDGISERVTRVEARCQITHQGENP